MNINFKGLIDLHHIPSSIPLLPVFEAVVNSIQSIEDANISNGKIEINLKRDVQMTVGENWETDIETVEIIDNGVGFTEKNYNSFNTYASDYKWERGCKGVGRIMWLKSFQDVNVESVYKDGEHLCSRKFKFDAKNEISDVVHDENCNVETEICTKITLNCLNTKFKKIVPKKIDTIARDILRHCFVFFVLENAPRIILSDGKNTRSINNLYDDYKKINISKEEFTIKGQVFTIIHAKNYNSATSSSTLNLCAHKRVVKDINLSSTLNLKGKLHSGDSDFVYEGFIISDYLDKSVNKERTKFNLTERDLNLNNDITESEVCDEALNLLNEFLKDELTEYNNRKFEEISEYVNRVNPRYRNLLKSFPECVKNIVVTDDQDKLEFELFKQEQAYKLKLKKDGHELQQIIGNEKDYKKATKKKAEYLEKISDLGKSSLAEYIIHRKTVLELLSDNLKYDDVSERRYAYEENIHQIIFPMRATSDDIGYQNHNLWILDEKLAYHNYLASDQTLKKVEKLDSDSRKEPDIIIFDRPFAFAEGDRQPYQDITIIEFKRPGRDDYDKNSDPIQQVIDYMDEIQSGKVRTKDGAFIQGSGNIRFFCYILCDIGGKIDKFAKQRDFKRCPDGLGYYHYIDSYGAYIEIVPYTKMIQDSQTRNKILFDKLFMG